MVQTGKYGYARKNLHSKNLEKKRQEVGKRGGPNKEKYPNEIKRGKTTLLRGSFKKTVVCSTSSSPPIL